MIRKIRKVIRDQRSWVQRTMFRILLLTLCASFVRGAYPRMDPYQGSASSDSPLVSRILSDRSPRFKIRTITAGVKLKNTSDLATVESAIDFLQRARKTFENEGYEIQTLRIATQPLPEYLNGKSRRDALADLKKIDEVVSAKNVLLSIGPVITDDRHDAEFPSWAAELVKETKNINFSVAVASPERGVQSQTALTAAEAIVAISKTSPGGEGNFRFTAAANCLAGTPFFPVAYHRGPAAFSIGLETPGLLQEAFAQAKDIDEGKAKLKSLLESQLGPVEKLASGIAGSEHREYLGIDVSPAPSKEKSIGAAIEALTRVPFGSASTLAACAAITDVLKSLRIKTCGYSGLMLPVLEDPVLATRAAEGRYSVRELLLYSSVCGTGLDVVPLAGDTSAKELAALIRDVAALSTKLHKPLSARLFLIPGKKAGERAEFNNPFLTSSVVMKLD
ncbi:MAG: DUF711 domain-containing protein [Acidobacteria bacterium]|nr:MAG: DUF711 domain-containing protein [Acidobacteriota bacterium]